MKMHPALAMAVLSLAICSSRAQTWSATILPSGQYYVSAASSADGAKLVVDGFDVVYTSTNSGTNWTLRLTNALPWCAAASSWDGTKLAVAAGGYENDGAGNPILGPILLSTDSGNIWTPANLASNAWKALACSTDGTKLVAAVGGNFVGPGPIFTSSDSGNSWTQTGAPLATWYSLASSADGTKLIAVGIDAVYTSTNSGTNWTPAVGLPDKTWTYACSSLDGTKLAVAPDPGPIYTSTNSGATWTQTLAPHLNWNALTCSADGSKLTAGNWTGGVIYQSPNAGVTWLPTQSAANDWTALVASADGNKLLGVDYTQGVYTSVTNLSPPLNIAGTAADIQVSWVIPSGPFTLQATADLGSMNWQAVPVTPAVNITNLQNVITVTPALGNFFFRLER